ncbi:tetratricopeptide repeat protein [Desulfogranum mediterraneum]|uniref:tetratricopeptide repeat protein n=1 Tax=Desulfogranum mediterraneum TaxID=160661 RepID=UPI0003F6054E|nr:tetratricopeptide repeat protein [Desulfogranum mediterraneum]
MLTFAPYESAPLSLLDFVILRVPFSEEVARALPVPVTTRFYSFQPDRLLPHLFTEVGCTEPQQRLLEEGRAPAVIGKLLVIPCGLDQGEAVAVVISEADPALLEKISSSWLLRLQERIRQGLETVRSLCLDPGTGIYNQRALPTLGQAAPGLLSFFLCIHVGIPVQPASTGMQRYQQLVEQLRSLAHGPLFSCGFKVFGVYLLDVSAKQALAAVHSLQRHLKRDGRARVQIGIADSSLGEQMVETAWQGLQVAEKRGPFGVCDPRSLANHPFALPSTAVLQEFRRCWRGVRHFVVAAFSWTELAEPTEVESSIRGFCHKNSILQVSEGRRTYLLFAGGGKEVVGECAALFADAAPALLAMGVEAVGLAVWPNQASVKTVTVQHAIKALMHCGFLEPGSAVFFDALTLNISGDYYFDQGDYYAAVREYRQGLRLAADDINLLNSLGVTLVECNQYARATECFEAVLRQERGNYMALVNLGYAQQAAGRKSAAVESLEQARSLIPEGEAAGGELFLTLGRLYVEAAQFQRAVDVLEQWAALPGSEQEFWLHRFLGRAYFEVGEAAKAVKACQRALQLYPQDSVSLSVLGVLYVEQGQGDEIGLRLCRKAVELDPVNPDNRYRQALAFFLGKQLQQAQESLCECLSLKRNHVDAHILQARIDLDQGREKKAQQRLQKNVKLSGCSDEQRQRLAAWIKA